MAKEEKNSKDGEQAPPATPKPEGGSGDKKESSLKSAFGGSSTMMKFSGDLGLVDRLGIEIPEIQTAQGKRSHAIPSFAVLRYFPTFGIPKHSSDAINTLAYRMYGDIQIALKRPNLPVTQVELIKQLLTLGGVRTVWKLIQRAYNGLFHASTENVVTQRTLYAAMGLDYDAWVKGAPTIPFEMNKVRTALQNYPIPVQFDLINVHEYMLSYLFMDGTSQFSQRYAFVPNGVWAYGSNDTTGLLSYKTLYDHGQPLDLQLKGPQFFIDLLNELVDAWHASTDFKLVNGYFRAAYLGEGKTGKEFELFNDTPAGLSFVYDAQMISAARNSLPVLANADEFNVRENATTGVLYVTASIPTSANTAVLEQLIRNEVITINTTNDLPTADELGTVVRWHPVIEHDGNNALRVKSCATEWIESIETVELDGDGFIYAKADNDNIGFVYATKRASYSVNSVETGVVDTRMEVGNPVENIAPIVPISSAFHAWPIMYGCGYDGNYVPAPSVIPLAMITPWEYANTIGIDVVRRKHTATVYAATIGE